MSISNPIARNDYVGNGVTVTWTYGFKIFAATDLAVSTFNTLAGVTTNLVFGVDYTVTGVGADAGGSITQIIATPLPATSTITLTRGMAFTQPAVLNNQGQFYPKTIEDALDRQTMLLQQMDNITDATVRLPGTEVPTALAVTVPALALRTNKFFGWDSFGNITALAATIPSALVSAFWNPILAFTTSLASRTALGTKETVYAFDSGVSPNHVLSGANIAAAGFVAPTALLDGATFRFKAAFASQASVDLSVNGLAAKQIFKKGADPVTGASLYVATSLRDYSTAEYITVQYNQSLDKFVLTSSIYAQDSMVGYGVSGASAGTTYTTGNGVKRVNFAITGNRFEFKADAPNTGACTLNVNSTGAKPIKVNLFGTFQDPPAGFFTTGDIVPVVYDGTNYVIPQDSSQQPVVSYGVSAASAGTAYTTGSGVKRITALTTGVIVAFKADVANTGACTLNVNGTGAVALKIIAYGSTIDPPAGSIFAGDIVNVVYDGTNYIILQDPSSEKLTASASFTAAASVSIPVVAGMRYRLEYKYIQNTSVGVSYLRFNSDAGANYKWAGVSETSAGVAVTSGFTAVNQIQVSNVTTVDIGAEVNATAEFSSKSSDSTIASVTDRANYVAAGVVFHSYNGGGYYDGAAAITSIQILPSAGNITGKYWLTALPS